MGGSNLSAVIDRPPSVRLRRRVTAVVAITVLAFGVFARPADAQKLPKDLGAYIGEADKLCAATNVKLLQAATKIETENARSTRQGRLKKVKIAKPKQVASFVAAVALPALTELSGKLRALPSPKGDEKTIASLLDGFDAGISALKKDPGSAVSNDPLKPSAKEFAAIRFGDVKFSACGMRISRDQPKK